MNFFKRAWLNLTAKKGRSILLILVTSAIMLFVLAGLLIRNAADTATSNAKQSVGATLTLSANREAAFKKMRSGSSTSKTSRPKLTTSPVKLSDAKKIAKLSNIASYTATVSTSANAKGFSAISTSGSSSASGMKGMGGSTTSSGDIAISGVTSTSATSAFENSSSKITKGRGITTADEGTNNVVIESELAKEDSLKVGDSIKLKATTGTKQTYTLKVVGIYKASASTQQGPGATDPSNSVYTSYTFANTVKGAKYKNTADSVTFNVSDPVKVSAAKKAGKALINTSKYSLTTDDGSYQTVKTSMANVKSFADKIVWLVAIAGTIILALIVILMIRERRYEIGVLLSLGEARWKIVAQFFVEMVMVLVVSIAIAGAGGKFVGNQLGKQLVSQQTTTATTSTMSTQQGPGGGGAPGGSTSGTRPSGNMQGGGAPGSASSMSSQKQAELAINVTVLDLVELGGFGLAIMFLSIMLASGGILRLQPKKVLIE